MLKKKNTAKANVTNATDPLDQPDQVPLCLPCSPVPEPAAPVQEHPAAQAGDEQPAAPSQEHPAQPARDDQPGAPISESPAAQAGDKQPVAPIPEHQAPPAGPGLDTPTGWEARMRERMGDAFDPASINKMVKLLNSCTKEGACLFTERSSS
jgi:hypothetical protein